MEEYYKISESELLSLLMAQFKLSALEAEGADNWSGYDYIWEHIENEAESLGLDPEVAEIKDIAKEYLKDYPKA